MSRFFKKIGVLLSAAVMSLSLFGCEKTKAADKHGKLTGHEIWCSSGEDITKYDDVYAFYRFDTDEVLDKPAREAAVKKTT